MKTYLLLLFILLSMKLFSQFSFSNLSSSPSLQENANTNNWFPARFKDKDSKTAKDFLKVRIRRDYFKIIMLFIILILKIFLLIQK